MKTPEVTVRVLLGAVCLAGIATPILYRLVRPTNKPPEYEFIEVVRGEPAAWSKCDPIAYALGGQLDDYTRTVVVTASELAATSAGVSIVLIDSSDQPRLLGDDRQRLRNRQKVTNRVDVVVSASTDAETAAGIVLAPDGSPRIDGGEISLNTRDLDPNDFERAVAVALHEWLHILGLDHVDDERQLMFGRHQSRRAVGEGDQAGLSVLYDKQTCS